ncbi:MAG: hypothetical protein AABY00_01630 [Nanoarchaeota archaeon]
MTIEEIRECFVSAMKADVKGKKHKGLALAEPDQWLAEHYIAKAKENLEDCDYYRKMRRDYKLPESWFYTLYYCGLAILSKFGVETRSQKCTALFLRYVKENKLIEYDDDFIERISVYPEKEHLTDVDKREEARYGPSIQIKEVEEQYNSMMDLCNRAISQSEEIVYSKEKFQVPQALID